jgi:hypothetical protein
MTARRIANCSPIARSSSPDWTEAVNNQVRRKRERPDSVPTLASEAEPDRIDPAAVQ